MNQYAIKPVDPEDANRPRNGGFLSRVAVIFGTIVGAIERRQQKGK